MLFYYHLTNNSCIPSFISLYLFTQSAENVLDRNFKDKRELEVLVSDLTYVVVLGNWNYVCLVLDLLNREIVGHTVGEHKSAELVQEALSTIPYDCSKIEMFHTDRGKEFDNTQIEEFLSAFHIQRSLIHKGTPHDNAVDEFNLQGL